MAGPALRESDDLRRVRAAKLVAVVVSDHVQAVLGGLNGEDRTTPRLVELVVTCDGALSGRCEGQPEFSTFLGAADLVRHVQGVGRVAELERDDPELAALLSGPLVPRRHHAVAWSILAVVVVGGALLLAPAPTLGVLAMLFVLGSPLLACWWCAFPDDGPRPRPT